MDSIERHKRIIAVDGHEFGLIVSGLKRQRRALLRDARLNKERGFVPDAGRRNTNELKLQTLGVLMDRLGIAKGDRT